MLKIERRIVQSDKSDNNVVSIGRDAPTQDTHVEYRSGKVYFYKEVGPDVWAPIEASIDDPSVSTGKLVAAALRTWPKHLMGALDE